MSTAGLPSFNSRYILVANCLDCLVVSNMDANALQVPGSPGLLAHKPAAVAKLRERQSVDIDSFGGVEPFEPRVKLKQERGAKGL